MLPVGSAEIAARLTSTRTGGQQIGPAAVKRWIERFPADSERPFPTPRWTISGHRSWDWPTQILPWVVRHDARMLTLDDLRQAHDLDLAASGKKCAEDVLAARGFAARQIRETIARVYGRDDLTTAGWWHIQPWLTGHGTIGILNIADGVAWDTGIAACPEVEDLGLGAAGTVTPSAGMADGPAGEITIDGTVAQRDGMVNHSGQPMAPSAPAGWRQIALPPWRGWDGTHERWSPVPIERYAPPLWIRPTLVAAGLVAHYGRPGSPDAGRCLMSTSTWAHEWPHGLPEWIEGKSTSVLDVVATRKAHPFRELRLPRGTDTEEAARVGRYIELARAKAARGVEPHLREAMRLALERADEAMANGLPGYPWLAARAISQAPMGWWDEGIQELWASLRGDASGS